MSYAAVDDVRISLGRPLTEDEEITAEALLDRIEARIEARIPTLDDRITAESNLLDLIVEIEADAVARVLRNPGGLLQEQDGDYAYTRDRRVASGELSLTDEEWARLGVKKGAFTIAPYLGRTIDELPSSLEEGPVWVNVYP